MLENSRVLVEELRIQQMELELQNQELRRIQADLEASRALYFDLYELAPVGYITLDENDVIVRSNLRAAGLLGTPRKSLEGHRFSEWVIGAEADSYRATCKNLLESRRPQVCEVKLRRHAREPQFWARLEMSLSPNYSIRDETSRFRRIVIVDVTERKMAEQRFDAFMSHSPISTAIIDQDGRYLDVNPSMMRYTGRSKDAWIGRTYSEVWPAGVWERLKRRHAQVLATNKVITETEILPFANQQRMEQVVTFPFLGPKGQRVVGWISVDLTDRHQLETALREANCQLEAEKQTAEHNTRAKSQFLSAMSHEIRTPLNGVVGMTGLLQHTALTAEQHGHVRVISHCAELLLALVNDVLDLSKIEAGKVELERAPFDLETIIADTLSMISFKALEKSLELASWYPANFPRRFIGDAGRIQQILSNLISNAVKFTEAGHVVVEVARAGSAGGKPSVCISVRDSGIGVAKQKQSALFDSYVQADSSIAKLFGGTGLGLSIVKQLAQLMEGTVVVESEEGKGATFRCNIPLEADMELVASTGHLSPRALEGQRVLVVSQRMGQTVAAEWCGRWGMLVEHSGAGDLIARLQKAAENQPFRLVILEGQWSAFAATVSSIRELDQTFIAPKLLIVSLDLPVTKNELVADAVLFAPIRSEVLRQTVSELVLGLEDTATAKASQEQLPNFALAGMGRNALRVLVTDDNHINQKIAAALLVRLGCQVDIADDGLSAVKKVSENEYDVVFMDCVMPGMNGMEATRAIRNLNGKPARVPIVALTASATPKDREECLAAGMDDYLTKPIRFEDLARHLAKLTNSANANRDCA